MTIFLLAFLIGVAVAGLLGYGKDSRDPAYSLRLRPYDVQPDARHLARPRHSS
jgi:hypothetical protein